VINVIPSPGGLRPVAGFNTIATAVVSDKPRDVFAVRSALSAVSIFVGTNSTLEMYDSGNQVWDDVTGTTVPSLSEDQGWTFTQFGQYVIAATPLAPLQVFELGVSSNFADLANAPTAAYVATVRDFVFTGGLDQEPYTLKWSAINDSTGWTPGTNLSDEQILTDGGIITGIVGGENCLVFQEDAVRLASFTGEERIIFQIDKISNSFGASVARSIAAYQNMAFFVHRSGIYMITTQGEWERIGTEKVDSYFWTAVNTGKLHLVRGTVDPLNKLYVLAFPSTGAPDCDSALVYHWPTKEWALWQFSEGLTGIAGTFYQASYTLDNIDSFGTVDEIGISFDSPFWSGLPTQYMAGFTLDDYTFGFFNGTPLEATIESGEFFIGGGSRVWFNGARPLVDSSSATLAIGMRDRPSDAVVFTSPSSQEVDGFCNVRTAGRYLQYRVVVPAGSNWTFFNGIGDVENVRPEGMR